MFKQRMRHATLISKQNALASQRTDEQQHKHTYTNTHTQAHMHLHCHNFGFYLFIVGGVYALFAHHTPAYGFWGLKLQAMALQ